MIRILDNLTFAILLSVLYAIGLTVFAYHPINMLQLNGYKINKKLFANIFSKMYLLYFVLLLIGALLSVLIKITYIVLVALLISDIFIVRVRRKTPLKFTPRVKRLFIIVFLLNVSVCLFLPPITALILSVTCCFTAPLLISPLEHAINQKFLKIAKKKINKRDDLIKIAITGSFGKTSVKNILSHILSCKYNVVATPHSYNTPLGISKCINLDLTEKAEVFIAEMGARKQGDIAYLCEIVKPQYAILTGISSAHLQTFGTVDNIVTTKGELLKALSPDGVAILNSNEVYFDRLCGMCSGTVVACIGENTNLYATQIIVDNGVTSFNLYYNGSSYSCKTQLLGAHNVDNILMCVALALELEVDIESIVSTIESISQIPHRLQVLDGGNCTIIDDSYNANNKGVYEGIRVLSSFSSRKIVITCGMVELGEAQYQMNFDYGTALGLVADVVMVNGVNAEAIKEGILSNHNNCQVSQARSLKGNLSVLKSIRQASDVIMFVNDLPDDM